MHGGQYDTVLGAFFAHLSVSPLLPFRTVQFIPQPLRLKPVPFDHSDYLFELKYDGFRALAYALSGRQANPRPDRKFFPQTSQLGDCRFVRRISLQGQN